MKRFSRLFRLSVACSSAALVLVLFTAQEASAGQLTATLTAQPSTINEGGSTTLTLSVQDTPTPSGTGFYNNYYNYFNGMYNGWDNAYFNGGGSIYYVNASVTPGGGQGSISLSGYGNGNTDYTAASTVQYGTPGSFTATVSASVETDDTYNINHFYWGWNGFGYTWLYSGTSFGLNDYTSSNISASTQVHVNNVAPTITSISFVPQVLVGENFGFSAAATDPGLAAGEQLTFAFDLNGTGQYSDFVQTGGTGDSGTYHFDNPGNYTVGIRVSDGNGGVTYGSFNVEVDPIPVINPQDGIAPEPATILLSAVALAGVAGYRQLRSRLNKGRAA